jgi:murein DD-endopeptidase MepM/ murein hydrolase activator NlpD
MERPDPSPAKVNLISPLVELKTMTGRLSSIFAPVKNWAVAISRMIPLGSKAQAAVGIGVVSVIGGGLFWNWAGDALLSGHLSPGAAARAALERAEAEREEEHEAFTSALATRQEETLEVGRGESLALVLSRAGIPWDEINPAVEAVSDVFNPRGMRTGQPISIYYEPSGEDAHLTGLAFRADPSAAITVSVSADGTYHAREIETPSQLETAHVMAKVSGSLYQSAIEAGATEREVAAISNVFSYDIDFQRDIFPGDAFELLFDRYFDEDGRTIKTGDLYFISLNTRRGPRAYYWFKAPGESTGAWYDQNGKSARKFLMKTPIDGARLSSSFGMRRHPILGYSKMHKGTDFAARVGTPIRAAGDGVVLRANWFSTYGNYVRIKHGNNYDTAYAHMSRFAAGIHSGSRVSQGQVIGYVGTTGNSTGPHLHYEVLHFNTQVNPMKLTFATGRNLEGKTLTVFKAERDRIDALRAGSAGSAPLIASAAGPVGGDLRGGLE